MQHNKQHNRKALLGAFSSRIHLDGYTLEFDPHDSKVRNKVQYEMVDSGDQRRVDLYTRRGL